MKAVIVIDMPDNLDIPLEDIKTDITAWSKDVRKSMLYLKYKNVELKPLPKGITNYEVRVSCDYDADYAEGWNDCIDEIVGETE